MVMFLALLMAQIDRDQPSSEFQIICMPCHGSLKTRLLTFFDSDQALINGIWDSMDFSNY